MLKVIFGLYFEVLAHQIFNFSSYYLETTIENLNADVPIIDNL